MGNSSGAGAVAAGKLERLAATERGERGRRAALLALVLSAVESAAAGGEASEFLARRAAAEVGRLPSGAERTVLRRLLETAGDAARSANVLSDLASGLEEANRLEEAAAAIELAGSLSPTCPEIALRAGRIARLGGDATRAHGHYRRVVALDVGGGALARLASVGEAAIAERPGEALGRAMRAAVRAGDGEAAGVALEERARVRRAAGDRRGAIRDLVIATARYDDPVDRARVAHHLADVLAASGDTPAAREVLVYAVSVGDRGQRDHARARLHALARESGDQVGMRRWRSARPPGIVSMSFAPPGQPTESIADRVVDWRDGLLAGSR